MKLIILAVAALVAVALAAPAAEKDVQILRYDNEAQPDGAYSYAVETSDGTQKQETGELKTVNDEENKPQTVVVSRGTYSYVDPEGKPHTINYFADETGYHAEGEDIPKAQ